MSEITISLSDDWTIDQDLMRDSLIRLKGPSVKVGTMLVHRITKDTFLICAGYKGKTALLVNITKGRASYEREDLHSLAIGDQKTLGWADSVKLLGQNWIHDYLIIKS